MKRGKREKSVLDWIGVLGNRNKRRRHFHFLFYSLSPLALLKYCNRVREVKSAKKEEEEEEAVKVVFGLSH